MKHMITGVILDAKNHNGRIYETVAMEEAFARRLEAPLYVTMDEPPQGEVTLDRICGVVETLERDGDRFYVNWRTVETPLGRIARTLLESDVKVDMIPLGTGMVLEDGRVADYEPIALYITPPGRVP